MRSRLYTFTEDAVFGTEKAPWAPTQYKISNLLEALSAIVILPDELEQPCWINNRESGTIIAVANGLLDLKSRTLIEHTPFFFNHTAVPFDYDPKAPAPKRWLRFLNELWPEEQERAFIDVLGEWYGYIISGRLDLQKILLMIGPTRGGKGVIARILTALVGDRNVAGPTLNTLAGDRGLAPLIGKVLAIISDARFTGKDIAVVVERLLSISGQDRLDIDRKYKDAWIGPLSVRLHILSNELPKFIDASTAIVGRLVLLLTKHSWLGKEDHNLEPELLTELPGILNWALDGLNRLTITNNNRFTHVASVDKAIATLRELASTVFAFVRGECAIGIDPATNKPREVNVDTLYATYKAWCDDNGHEKPSKNVFGRNLVAAFPTIDKQRRGKRGARFHVYVGIALQEGGEDEPENEMEDIFAAERAHGGWQPKSGSEAATETKSETKYAGGIPLVMTNAMKAQLRVLGYSDAQIANLTPPQASRREREGGTRRGARGANHGGRDGRAARARIFGERFIRHEPDARARDHRRSALRQYARALPRWTQNGRALPRMPRARSQDDHLHCERRNLGAPSQMRG